MLQRLQDFAIGSGWQRTLSKHLIQIYSTEPTYVRY